MRNDRLTIIVILISVLVLAVPIVSDSSEASVTKSANGVNITIFDDNISLNAGVTTSSQITFINSGTSPVSIYITSTDDSNTIFSEYFSEKDFSLDGEKSKQIDLYVSTDKLSKHGTYSITIAVSVYNYGTATTEETTIPVTVNVTSSYSSDGVYNRILGVFDPLGEPFNAPIYTAAITMVIWGAVAVAAYIVLYLIVSMLFKSDKDVTKEISRKSGVLLIASILFYGLSNTLMAYGANEIIIAFLQNLSSFLYIPIIAFIVWNIYTNTIKHIFHRMEEQDRIAGADTSLIPLFNMLGKIVITVVAASALLHVLGYDLVAIITGAGIAGMAISLGAQNTLTEFFSGINLLSTRPFKRGDMVMVGGKDIYQVEKVGLLNSRFKNWISMEYIVMPNSMVTSSTIMNITGKTMAYRIYLDYTVAYGSDIELTKKILLDTAYNHPQVIVDGSYSKPDARLMAFEDSAIKFTLAIFITDFRDYIAVTDELNEDVYRNLCKAGIEIPYNKLDVYIKEE